MKLYPIYDQYTRDIWMSIPYLLLAIGCGAKAMLLQRENKNLLYGCQKYVLKCHRCGTMLYTDMAMKRSFPFGWFVKMSEEEVERSM